MLNSDIRRERLTILDDARILDPLSGEISDPTGVTIVNDRIVAIGRREGTPPA